MNKFWSSVYKLYVKFRNAIGWYHVRELWVAELPINEEREVCGLNILNLPQEIKDTYEKDLNLPALRWDCWFEGYRYIGKLGDWPSNYISTPEGIGKLASIIDHTQPTVDNRIYLPRYIMDKKEPGNAICLPHKEAEKITSVCVIHVFQTDDEAQVDRDIRIKQLEEDCRRMNDLNSIGIYHHE